MWPKTLRTKGFAVIAFLVVVVVCALAGISLLVAMFWRDEPFLGAIAMMVLSVGGVASTAYGALNSM